MNNKLAIYSNGIGCFTSYIELNGKEEKTINLLVSRKNVSDVLASFMVKGDGVRLTKPPRYSPANEEKSIELNPNNVLLNLVSSFAGAEVVVGKGDKEIKGTLFGLHGENTSDGGETYQKQNLIVVDKDGSLVSIPMSIVTHVNFTQEVVKTEIQKAKNKLFNRRCENSTIISLGLSSNKPTTAMLQYMLPFSSWRAAYHINKNEKTNFLGYAIIDNPTDEELKNYELEFITGDPSTYEKDLAEPRFIKRKKVNLVKNKSVAAPQLDDSSGGSPMMACAAPTNAFRIASVDMAKADEISDIGDFYSFTVEGLTTIPAKESAVIPIFNSVLTDANKKVLYYKESEGIKPWRAFLFKNENKFSLTEGFCTIWDKNTWIGEAIMPDIRPNEVKLIPYGVENGVKVIKQKLNQTNQFFNLKFYDGVCVTSNRTEQQTNYIVKNDKCEKFEVIIDHEYNLSLPEINVYCVKRKKKLNYDNVKNGIRISLSLDANEEVKISVEETNVNSSQIKLSSDKLAEASNYLLKTGNFKEEQDAIKDIFVTQASIDEIKYRVNEIQQNIGRTEREQVNIRDNMVSLTGPLGSNNAMADKWKNKLNELMEEHSIQNKKIIKYNDELKELENKLHKQFFELKCEWVFSENTKE